MSVWMACVLAGFISSPQFIEGCIFSGVWTRGWKKKKEKDKMNKKTSDMTDQNRPRI